MEGSKFIDQLGDYWIDILTNADIFSRSEDMLIQYCYVLQIFIIFKRAVAGQNGESFVFQFVIQNFKD